ncbi:F-box protein CPR1 [Andrographis paniculata]|uniref:F-box protein CPR1 n=1 Tax=Andrographis paniculata TaxID=175694 RepID=UPI0021E764BB|nr:F-box protein CPR1 [Andrographis paniculata]
MPALPFEIVEDILRRLPVKSLKRFRAVAKSWCFLIDSERFAKLHLQQSLISNTNRSLILGGLGLYRIGLDSLEEAEVIKPPFYYRSVDGISNSCNGVVLVMCEPAVLWNPFSADFKVLPECSDGSPTEVELYPRTTYGFGYVSRTDDYKVVRVVEFRHKINHFWMYAESSIYSLRSNCWTKIDSFPYPLPFLRGHWRVHVNGALHTLEISDLMDSARIMAFDLDTEKHNELTMPPGIQARNFDLNLDMIGGCLSVVCSRRSRVIVWVMKEYGVKESWTKLFSISFPEIERDDFLKLLVYSQDGNRVLLNCDDKRLVWYDLRKKTAEKVCVEGIPFVFYAEACVETLISPDSSGEVKKLQHVETKRSQEKRKVQKIRNKRDDFLSEGFKLVL